MNNKSILQNCEEEIYINYDLTREKRGKSNQAKIRKITKEERTKGKRVKTGFHKQ